MSGLYVFAGSHSEADVLIGVYDPLSITILDIACFG